MKMGICSNGLENYRIIYPNHMEMITPPLPQTMEQFLQVCPQIFTVIINQINLATIISTKYTHVIGIKLVNNVLQLQI